MSMILNWISDKLGYSPSNDIIDLYFVMSDLKDITLTPEEILEAAELGQAAMKAKQQSYKSTKGARCGGSNPYTGDDRAIGKTVL